LFRRQVDAAPGAVQVVAEQLVGGAGGGAKATVHAAAQDAVRLPALGGVANEVRQLGLHGEVLWRLQIRVKPARVEDARRIELGLETPVQLHQRRRRGWEGGGALVANPPEQARAA